MKNIDRIREEIKICDQELERIQAKRTACAKALLPYNIALIGFMGTGKSTISAQLQKMLPLDLVDTDALIVEEEGMSINDIFAKYGETYFRDCETRVTLELQDRELTIISCGGGMIMRPENEKNLKKTSKVVLLTATPETIYQRVRHSTNRPILNGHMNVEYIAQLMERRRARYEEAADIIVSTDGKTAQEICEEILFRVGQQDAVQTVRQLSEIRVDIDRIDGLIQQLLMERLDCSAEVVASKIIDQNYTINRPDRELAMLERLGADVPEDRKAGYLAVVRKITETSRMFQYGRLYDEVPELFAKLVENVDMTKATELVKVRLERPDAPNGMSAILAMIGDYGFDMEQMQLIGYEDNHSKALFELVIRGNIQERPMQKLLLQLSMESEQFEICQG